MMKIVGKCYLSVADVILQDIDVNFITIHAKVIHKWIFSQRKSTEIDQLNIALELPSNKIHLISVASRQITYSVVKRKQVPIKFSKWRHVQHGLFCCVKKFRNV